MSIHFSLIYEREKGGMETWVLRYSYSRNNKLYSMPCHLLDDIQPNLISSKLYWYLTEH